MAGKFDLYAWAERAVKHIRFLPDRFGVREELRAHLEDRYEALTAGGLDEGLPPKRPWPPWGTPMRWGGR